MSSAVMSRRPSKVVVTMEPRASVSGYEHVSLTGSPSPGVPGGQATFRYDDDYDQTHDEPSASRGLLMNDWASEVYQHKKPIKRRTTLKCLSRWPMVSTLAALLVVAAASSLGTSLYFSAHPITLHPAASHALSLVGLASTSNSTLLWETSQDPYIYATPKPLLEPYEVHPIKVLMRRAKQEWEEKASRQSKTLEDAVREYERRYGRDPPPRFEDWYNFATANNVQLIDEYDSILTSLSPFFAMHPSLIKRRATELTNKSSPAHALIRVANGAQISTLGADWRPAVVDNWKVLLDGIVQWLPDLEIPVYLHDGAHSSIDWEARKGYEDAAAQGLFVDEGGLPVDGETAYRIRDRECSPESKFRRVRSGMELGYPVSSGPAFINRHHAAMDYCNNPDFMQLHGAVSTMWDLGPLEPSFSMSKQNFNGDILWPAGILYDLNPEHETLFFQKKIHKIVWRGSLDGIDVHPDNDWRSSHRYRLISLSSSTLALPKTLRTTAVDSIGQEYQQDVKTTLKKLNERYTDMRATGIPLQCDPGLCEAVQRETDWAEFMSKKDMSDHRYVMDVDGNSYSARFRTHLLSNQVPLKSTVFAGWYSERIQPWLHYVPTRVDYSDLYDILAFFDGDLTTERKGNHDALAESIANAGKDWALTHWRTVDMQAYTFRLLLEYARILEDDRTPPRPTNYTVAFP